MVMPLIVGGAILSAYGNMKAADAEGELLHEQADLLELSAERVMKLNEMNTEQTLQDERETRSAKGVTSAARGVSVNLNTLSAITKDALKEIEISTEEAKFEAQKLKIEASAKRRSAKSGKDASKLSAISSTVSILGGIK